MQPAVASQAVIYGNDDRLDYTEVADQDLRDMARSTVALIDNDHLVYDSVFDKFNLEHENSGITLCGTEKFRKQPLWAHCSGTLVAPDLIITAGHCVENARDCKNTKFVFDYTEFEKNMVMTAFPAANVYGCKEIIHTTQNKNGADFAIVRLERDVKGRPPLAISERAVTYHDAVMMIGHPAGMPTKFTMNGKVRNLLPENYFAISIDAFSGNSGSGIFDQATHKIVGVLARGENDYERENGCYFSKKCDEDGCRGEDVTKVSEIIKFLPRP